MGKVRWDEEGLSEAARQIASIPKRADRPPPEPKTPFASTTFNSEDESMSELKLSTSASDSDHNVAWLSGDESEREDFLQHRKSHYRQGGVALHKGRKAGEEEGEEGGDDKL